MPRPRSHNVRKVCRHGWRKWPKCPCAWYFSYKPRGGARRYRFSLDAELGFRIESKTEAENAANTIRQAILDGTFERAADRHSREGREAATPRTSDQSATASASLTLDEFATDFITRVPKANGKESWKDDEYLLATLRNFRTADGTRLGERPLHLITEDDLETFHAGRRGIGDAVSTLNHYVQIIKASFRWAAKKGFLPHSPISDETSLKRKKVAQRRRRVSEDEEAKLLNSASTLKHGAGPRLQWLIIAAIETGARRGELLRLRWADVDADRRTVLIRAVEKGARKTRRSRRLPISTRLAGVLNMATLDPDGKRYPPTAYVFGELGELVLSVDTGWETCVLRAHGHEPKRTSKGALVPESRLAYRMIDLHFNDLRHEAGSRWLEASWPLHHIQEMLGHTNLSQTSTYLHASEHGLQDSMKRFDTTRGKDVAKPSQSDHRPVGHSHATEQQKDLLH